MIVCVLQCTHKPDLPAKVLFSGQGGKSFYSFAKLVMPPYLFESRHCGQKKNLAEVFMWSMEKDQYTH